MKITVDKNAKTVPTNFSWQFGVGNDHAFQLHRKDVCNHVKLVHDELGMKYIRFHGIFDDDMLCFQRLSDYKPFAAVPFSDKIDEINFKQIADVFDNVLACGMKPFVELSFMPGALASGNKTGIRYLNNITRPKSMDKWVDFIKKFIKFLSEYYGSEEIESWYFEVWNEPDLAIFFKGSQKDYFSLYASTARAVKSVNSRLRVGGPSSSACLWIEDFTEYCRKNDVPCDFISTHHYPGDAFGNTFSAKDAFRMMSIAKNAAKNEIGLSKTMKEMFFRPDIYKTWRRGVLNELDKKALEQANGKPLIITEWNSMAVFASPIHDEKNSAAFIVKTCVDADSRLLGTMFWCCSDIYEEQFMLGKPFHGGFGLVSNCGIPKPNFWAFKILSQLHKSRLALPESRNSDIEHAAFTDGEKVQVLIYAQDNDYGKFEKTEIELEINISAKSVTAQIIDNNHCNPKAEWDALGSPDILTKSQVAEIKAKTALKAEGIPFSASGGSTTVKLTVETNDVILLSLE